MTLEIFIMWCNIVSREYPWQLKVMDVESGVKKLQVTEDTHTSAENYLSELLCWNCWLLLCCADLSPRVLSKVLF